MSKLPLSLFIICLMAFNLIGQTKKLLKTNNQLKGQVYYISSGKKPAIGVTVKGIINAIEKSNTQYTSNKGDFTLVFANAKDGHKVDLELGEKDEAHNKIEIVNRREVGQCRIPAIATDIFEIFVCNKNTRDLAAQKFYNIIKTSSDREILKLQNQYDKLNEQKKRDFKKINELSAHIFALEQQVDTLFFLQEAIRLAEINKDFASDRMLAYITCIEDGGMMQECRKLLDVGKAMKEARTLISNFTKSSGSIIEEIETDAKAAAIEFDYKTTFSNFDSIIYLLKKAKIDRDEILPYYILAAKYAHIDGKYKVAMPYHKKALSIVEKMDNPIDSLLANTYDNLGITYNALGEYDSALVYTMKGLTIRENMKDSSGIAISCNNIGATYQGLSRIKESLTPFKKSIAINKIMNDSINLAIAFNNIGVSYYYLSKLDSAIYYTRKFIHINERITPENPSLGVAYGNMAVFQKNIGNKQAAEFNYRKALYLQETALDDFNPQLALNYNNFGLFNQSIGQYDTAFIYYDKALNIQLIAFDSIHPDVALTINNYSTLYRTMGKYEKALEFQKKALRIMERIYPAAHINLITTYSNTFLAYKNLGRTKEGVKYIKKAVSLAEENLAPNHSDLASLYVNLSIAYKELINYKEAIKYSELAINISEKNYGEKHTMTARAYDNFALLLNILKRYEEALKYYELTLSINYEILDSSHVDIGLPHTNYGNTFRALKRYQKALKHHNKAINILSNIFNDTHPHMASAYQNRGYTYLCLNQFDKAFEDFQIMEEIRPDHKLTPKHWALYYTFLNQKGKAIEYLEKAVDLGMDDLDWLKTAPHLNSLRKERSFKKLIKRLKKKENV